MKNFLIDLLGLIVMGSIVYGLAWLGKTISYKWWYEDQVEQTVYEILVDEGLIQKKD